MTVKASRQSDTTIMRAANIFVSYAHEDEPYRRQLDAHMAALRRAGLAAIWHDRKIMPGDNLNQVIDSKIETADVVLLLISPAFLDSDYCFEIEMRRALARHEEGKTRVIPVIVRPCHWKGMPFAHLVMLPTDALPVTEWPNQDKAWLSVAVGLGQMLEEKHPALAEASNDKSISQSPALAKDDECLLRVSRLSQRAEKLLRERFGATGNGLGELLRSRRAQVRELDSQLERALSKFAPLRNKILHNEDHDIDLGLIERELKSFEERLARYISNTATVVVQEAPRQWFVCQDGMGDFVTISEALVAAGANDTIFVLPGTYQEEVVIVKPLSVTGKPNGAAEIIIEPTEGDGVQIGADGVCLADLVVRAQAQSAFAVVAFPATQGTKLKRCRLSAPTGTGVAVMNGATATLSNCSVENCSIGIRGDGAVTMDRGNIVRSEHGVLTRGAGSVAFEKACLNGNQVAVELRDDSRATFTDCSFEPGEFGAVATDRSVCNLNGCHFGAYGADAMTVKMSEECVIQVRGRQS